MAILFIPILLGMKQLYPWVTGPGDMADDPNYRYKLAYLNPQFFIVRVVIYFAILLTLSYFLNKWSREQDRTGDPSLAKKLEGISGPGLILWGIVVTYSMIDWVMSLEPKWFSTIYGMIFMIVGALTAMSFIILMLRRLSDEAPFKGAVTPGQYNDLGNLMLTFTMLWAYLSFSQFLIIWSGNIKDEIPWYMTRAFGDWAVVAVILIVLHFGLPFLLLLQRNIKRRIERLYLVAAMMLILGIVDVYWLIVPAYEQDKPHFGSLLLDILFLVIIGAIWISLYFRELKKMPLLPLHDPRFEGELQHEHGD
jgi:cytochrome bd-type quinol oxidase subunit 2